MISISNKFVAAAFLATTGIVYLLYHNYAEDVSSLRDIALSLKNLTQGDPGHRERQEPLRKEVLVTLPEDEKEIASTTEKNEEYPHNDLYERNLTLINITNFKFVINNDICNVRRIALVTIIHTAVDNHEARSMIRSVTWQT